MTNVDDDQLCEIIPDGFDWGTLHFLNS